MYKPVINHMAKAALVGLFLVWPLETYSQESESPLDINAPSVGIEIVRREPLHSERVFSGRIEAIAHVDLIARVDGFIEPLRFNEGQAVKEGEVLFVIRQDTYNFKLEQARAALISSEAQLEHKRLDLDRKEQLVERQAIPVSEVDISRADLREAEADVLLKKAELDLAELDLSYTEIKAPMDGRIGIAAFKQGAYVTNESGTLATVTALDPMRVAFPVPQDILGRWQASNVLENEATEVRIRLRDGSYYPLHGKIEFIDTEANEGTDSVTVRALFPNPDGALFERQLVDVTASPGDRQSSLVISELALLIDDSGPYVYLVNEEGTVEQRRIKVADQFGGRIIVSEGLLENEKVVTAGLQKIKPGDAVHSQLSGR